MDILIAVDGTGTDNDEDYKKEFGDPAALYCSPNQSHVFTLHQSWHSPKKWYSRGPTTLGLSTHELAADAVRATLKNYQPGADRIFLTGYSRGGAAVIQAAAFLVLRNIPVHAMFLYDAVDRAAGIVAAEWIPPNVRHCYHAVRDPKARSRKYFGNCGLLKPSNVQLEIKPFMGTHGALGGLPWSAAHVSRNGRINEHGAATEGAAGTAKMLAKGAVALGIVAAGPAGFLTASRMIEAGSLMAEHATRNALSTAITPEQDKRTALQVGQWMYDNLRRSLLPGTGQAGA